MPTFQVYVNGKVQTDLQFSGADQTKLESLIGAVKGL